MDGFDRGDDAGFPGDDFAAGLFHEGVERAFGFSADGVNVEGDVIFGEHGVETLDGGVFDIVLEVAEPVDGEGCGKGVSRHGRWWAGCGRVCNVANAMKRGTNGRWFWIQFEWSNGERVALEDIVKGVQEMVAGSRWVISRDRELLERIASWGLGHN